MKLFGRNKARKELERALRGHEPPTLPQGVLRLLKLLREPDSDIGDLAAALQWDPGLSVRVLKTVNSAAYGAARRIDEVRHAVSMLGRGPLEQLVLGIAVAGSLPRGEAPGFRSERFWHTAFFRAALARSLAGELHPADQARSFTGGLLQDMAVPVLAHARPGDYGPVLEEWHGVRDARLHELEREALGLSHDQVGALLAGDWELPEALTRVIAAHHDDGAADSELPPALRLVSVHKETECEHGVDAMIEDARDLYGLEADWTRGVVQSAVEQARELAGTLL